MEDHFEPLKHLREQCNFQVYLDDLQNIWLRFGPGSGLESIMTTQSIAKQYNAQLQLKLKNQCIINHLNFTIQATSKPNETFLPNKTKIPLQHKKSTSPNKY